MSKLNRYYAGKHALVTGGSSGIGAALARRLVELGAGVTLVARSAGPLSTLTDELRRLHPAARVRTLELDIADEQAVAALVPRELDEQPVDLVVNNAGIAHAGRLMETPPERFRALVETNLLGTIWMTRAVVPHLRDRGRGHLVNVASMAAVEGVYGYAAYAPSKFAIVGFTQVLRAELRPDGIGVSLLLPPNTDTPQLAAEIEQLPPEMRGIHQASRVMRAPAVAEVLLRGVAKGRFEIVPGLDGRILYRLHRLTRAPLRAYFDREVRRGLATPAAD